ncbi:hypothetical protein [Acidovorax sp. SUPP3334]|uniref:hypothetical protein n=1 Tax=Acidovorax sp. SUPP3334 TaxID=2920881 RepID=UPI0023DE5D59|nr:hypothetical protein [Acidovorax sp. SUPP3334]GKT26180.1 hypothetical protein AVHM3334_20275 [Acidovorax sp. SUPP3334]
MDEEIEQLTELKQRFPYMFSGPHIGLDIYRGWLSDFINACEAIDALLAEDKRGFHWKQTKAKYGFARYYFDTDAVRTLRLSFSDGKGVYEVTKGLDGHDIEQRINKICNDAEQASMTKCIVCGGSAEIKSYGSWAVCACEKHSPDVPGNHLKSAVLR